MHANHLRDIADISSGLVFLFLIGTVGSAMMRRSQATILAALSLQIWLAIHLFAEALK